MAGITGAGFVAKRQDEIKQDLEDEFRSEIEAEINTASASVAGQIIGILSSALAENWELVQSVYSSQLVRAAEGFTQDNLYLLLGVERKQATKSKATLTVNLDSGVTVPQGSRVQVDGNDAIQFETDTAITNGTGSTGDFEVKATALETGPIRANAGTIETIIDTVTGWNSVTNANDATPGTFTQSHEDFRTAYRSAIFAAGACTPDAIRAKLLELTGVQQVTIFENVTDAQNADGLPAHSFEAVIFDGEVPAADDSAIAQTIWDNKPAGVRAHGALSDFAVDSNGVTQEVFFSRTEVVAVWLEIDINVDKTFSDTGKDAVREALILFSEDEYRNGDDVIESALYPAIFSVAGVTNVLEVRLGFSSSPVSTSDLQIDSRQLADFDTSRIKVNVL